MKSILYVLIATALISTSPFLISFTPECIPVRGIFIYSILTALLFFVNLKEMAKSRKQKILVFGIAYFVISSISWIDTQSIISLLNLNIYIYSAIPFITSIFALFILNKAKTIPLRKTNLVLFSVLFLHFATTNTYIEQPLLTFTLLQLF